MVAVLLDHNVSRQVGPLLQAAGHDVIDAQEATLNRAKDDQVLLAASEAGGALITHNISDFQLLHDAWRRWSGAWQRTLPLAVGRGLAAPPVRPQPARFSTP